MKYKMMKAFFVIMHKLVTKFLHIIYKVFIFTRLYIDFFCT